MMRGFRVLAVLCLSCLLSACSQWRYDLGAPLPALPEGQPFATGTPLAEVLSVLGPPLRISATNQGYALLWEYWQVRENTLGFSLGALGVDFLSVDLGEAHARTEMVMLQFTADHRLRSGIHERWDSDVGGGRSVQPLASLVSVVDVDDLVERLPQQAWGRQSLELPPITLNHQNRPDQGQAGISQRGVPAGIGQRSLEMD